MGNLCGKPSKEDSSAPGRVLGTTPRNDNAKAAIPAQVKAKPKVGGPPRTLGDGQGNASSDAGSAAAAAAEVRFMDMQLPFVTQNPPERLHNMFRVQSSGVATGFLAFMEPASLTIASSEARPTATPRRSGEETCCTKEADTQPNPAGRRC